MQIEHLKELLMLAETGNITTAAQAHYISAATLSRHISAMESELGFRLFTRDTHRTSLTAAGACFVDDVRSILVLYQDAIIKAEAIESNSTVLRVGFLADSLAGTLPHAMLYMRKNYPSITVNLLSAEHESLIEGLALGRFDVVLTLDINQSAKGKYHYTKLGDGQFVAVVSNDHPLARKSSISLEDLSGHTVLLPCVDGLQDYHQACQKILFAPELELSINQTCVDFTTILLSAESGFGVGIVPGFLSRRYQDRETFIPFDDSIDSSFGYGAFWGKSESESIIKAFVELLGGQGS